LRSGLDVPYRAVKTNIADSLNVVIPISNAGGTQIQINSYDADTDLFDYCAIYVDQHDIQLGKGRNDV
jgi:hypothetical protein